MRLLISVLLILGLAAAQDEPKNIETRAISEPGQGDKFKIYVGTIDGVRREIFNEVDGGQIEVAPDNTPNPVDPFGAYDDNNVITTDNEKVLFVPKPYRPGGDKKTTKKPATTRPPPPPTTIRTIPFVQTTPAPLATLPPVTRPPFQPVQPQPIATIQPFNNRPPPTAPPRVLPQQPIRPIQPQQPFRPFTQQPQVTRQPFVPQTRPTLAPAPQTRPPPPVAPIEPATTPRPRAPFQQGQNLRTGQCPASIFYISTPISGPSRLTFTHFAVAVTVDQCARTCHEFNCAIAHYNPINGHCEFNPSTAFAIRNGQCPAWPSLHYRNNVVANEPVRIFCVQCQRPRRRPSNGRTFQRGQARRGQRLGRKSATHSVETAAVTTKSRRNRETSAENAASSTTSDRSNQLTLLKQLEDLQL